MFFKFKEYEVTSLNFEDGDMEYALDGEPQDHLEMLARFFITACLGFLLLI